MKVRDEPHPERFSGSEADRALFDDLIHTLDATETFFASLTPGDWAKPHGSRWTFLDVPIHLAAFNGYLTEQLRHAEERHELYATRAALDAFNEHELAARGTADGTQAVAQFRESTDALREALALHPGGFDAPVFLPALRARGWFTARLGIEYIAFHNWLHLAEAHLRLRGTLPDLPAHITHRHVDFYMQIIPGALNTAAALGVSLRWRLTLTGKGGGVWTIRVTDGRAEMSRGADGTPDAAVTASVETFFAATYFNMRNPLTQLLLGRFRVNLGGLRKVGLIAALFNPPRDQPWAVFEREQVTPPA